jgi:hypothetical protein
MLHMYNTDVTYKQDDNHVQISKLLLVFADIAGKLGGRLTRCRPKTTVSIRLATSMLLWPRSPSAHRGETTTKIVDS